ncbi:MAG TPA: hypothetical protein VIL23_01730 [Clostridia bacterium]
MDYGKLAYIGLNDVNKRLQNLEKSQKSALTVYTHAKTLSRPIDNHCVYEIKFGANGGPLSVMGKLKLKHAEACRAEIIIKLNELLCYFDSCSFEAGVQEYLIFAAAQTQSGNNSLKIEISGTQYQGELLGLDLNLLGDGLKSFEPDERLELINRPGKNLAASLSGGKIACYLSDTGVFDFEASSIILGAGTSFSICQGYDNALKTALVYIDADKNLYFTVLGGQPIFLDDNAVSAAVFPIQTGYLVAYIKDFKAYYRFVFWGLEVSNAFPIDSSIRLPETVTAVFDAPAPTILIKTSDQKVYIKLPKKSIFAEEKLKDLTKISTHI